ncbi:somatostatin-1 [Embiotoca jacksoni]|uniref:somatostatin-1 n=1 Tax=Embiotoca jacksoni TaxID=100190 RepID=UPI003703C9CC
MLRSLVQLLLVALCSSVLPQQVGCAPHGDLLVETLRADLTSDKALTRLLLLKFMSDLTAAKAGELLRDLEEVEEEVEEEAGGREEVMKRHLPLSQRERKVGCRNFFWKTFTSC